MDKFISGTKFWATLVIALFFLMIAYHQGWYANWIFLLPSTFFHELMHYSIGLIFDANPHGFSIVPDTQSLGRILFEPTSFNVAFVSLAPLYLVPLSFLIVIMGQKSSLFKLPFYSYGIQCMWFGCIPSSVDIDLALTSIHSCILFAITYMILCFVIYKTTISTKKVIMITA